MAGLWRHPKSRMFWFRMGVPERYSARASKREWRLEDITARAGPAMTPTQEALAVVAKRVTGRWAAVAQAGIGRES